MDFGVKSWGWVGDMYQKVESMIQEVDDIMKEEACNVGLNAEESSEDEKKLSPVEVQAAPQRAKEIHPPPTDGKKPEEEQEAFEPPVVNGITGEHDQSEEEQEAFEPPLVNGITVEHDQDEEEQEDFEPPVDGMTVKREQDEEEQEATEPHVNGNAVQHGQSEEEHAQTTCDCKSTLKCGDEVSRVITRHFKIVQSLMDDPKATEFEPVTQVAGSVSSDSSVSLGSHSDIGEIERSTVSGIARDMQDDELKDSGSSIASLVDLVKDSSVESPGAHSDSILTDNNDDPSNVKEAVLESSKCQDELYEMFVNMGAVGGKNIYEREEAVTNSLSASPMHVDESHLLQEIGETCSKVEFSGDSVTFSTNASAFNNSSVAITAKLMERMELEALTNASFENRCIIDGSKLSHSPLSGTSGDSSMETIDLVDDREELQESCASVDIREFLAISQRVKGFRSFKSKIMDAFGLRRRTTAKEYEQLGIMQGDVNFDCGEGHAARKSTVPFPDNRSGIEHADDSDWELL